ncbi:MAG: hypothetical protein ACLSDQ_05635 [Adlercreutzia equolifaciens]
MKNIILDFDNTMGVRGCDVDDGLALLYLLGNPERCRVLAACTTYATRASMSSTPTPAPLRETRA